jgi:hypothetical protein
MSEELRNARSILTQFESSQRSECPAPIDRPEVVAHALLSALTHHWPTFSDDGTRELLNRTLEIKEIEHSRWITQRRIAIAKLARHFENATA